MKIKGLVILAVTAAMILSSCNPKSGVTGAKVKSADDSLAYALGIANYFYYMASDSIDINPVFLAKGMLDAKNGKNTLDEQSAQAYVMTYMQNRQAQKMKQMYGKNIDEGEKFLAENKKREGVQETTSGLQYEVITMGTGENPDPATWLRFTIPECFSTAPNSIHLLTAASLPSSVSARSYRDGRKVSN